jgi:ABC-type dipeptide/oligopeptide/nickel transport system ATPase component
MRSGYDFIVHYTPDKKEMFDRIFYSLIVERRLKMNKPCVINITGASGEGKTMVALRIMDALAKTQDLPPLEQYLGDVMIFNPRQFHDVIAKIRNKKDPLFWKINFLDIDEARDLLPSKEWRSKTNQAISDTNAIMRGIKPILIIITSQYVRDVDVSVRRTYNFIIKATRTPKQPSRLEIHALYENDNDIENTKFLRRRLVGKIIMPNGKVERVKGLSIMSELPRPELRKLYKDLEEENKNKILDRRLQMLANEWSGQKGVDELRKAVELAEYYALNPGQMGEILLVKHNKIKLKEKFNQLHAFDTQQKKEFTSRLAYLMKNRGLVDGDIKTKYEE